LADVPFLDARLGDALFVARLFAGGLFAGRLFADARFVVVRFVVARFVVARCDDRVFVADAGLGARPPPARKAPLAGV
jgi:hypothetical protein